MPRNSSVSSKSSKKLVRAGLYVRISQDPEGLRAGVERQREDCEALVARQGWSVAHVFEDNDISASRYSKKVRPGFRELCHAIESGAVDVVVAYHSKRLIRRPRELEDFIDLLEGTGVHVVTVQSGAYDLTTAAGQATARIMGALGHMESMEASERIRRQRDQAATEGRPFTGYPPFGYRREPGTDRIVIEASEAARIRRAVKALLAGTTSLRRIAAEWNQAGLQTRRGGAWRQNSVGTLLRSPTLAGLRVHRGEIVGEGDWKPILDRATWERLQSVLTGRPRGPVPRRWPWAGAFVCANCGSPLRTMVNNGSRAWACRSQPGHPGCGTLAVKAEPLEMLALTLLAARVSLSKGSLIAGHQNAPEGASDGLLDALKTIEGKLADIEDARFVTGSLSHAGYLRTKTKLEAELAGLHTQMHTGTQTAILKDLPVDPDRFRARWTRETVEWQQTIIRTFIRQIVVLPAARRGEPFHPGRIKPPDWRA